MFLKDKDALLDFAIDWTEACGDDRTVATSSWQVEPAGGEWPLTVADQAFEPMQATVRLGGGQPGRVYRVGNSVGFSDGTGDERSLVVRVEER